MPSKMAVFLFWAALCMFVLVFVIDLACMLYIVPASAVKWAGPAASCGMLFLFLGAALAWRSQRRSVPW
jgi:hypothetical protein